MAPTPAPQTHDELLGFDDLLDDKERVMQRTPPTTSVPNASAFIFRRGPKAPQSLYAAQEQERLGVLGLHLDASAAHCLPPTTIPSNTLSSDISTRSNRFRPTQVPAKCTNWPSARH